VRPLRGLTLEVRRGQQLAGHELAGTIAPLAQAGQARPAVGTRLDRPVRHRLAEASVWPGLCGTRLRCLRGRAGRRSTAPRPYQPAVGPIAASGMGCEAADAEGKAGWRNVPSSRTAWPAGAEAFGGATCGLVFGNFPSRQGLGAKDCAKAGMKPASCFGCGLPQPSLAICADRVPGGDLHPSCGGGLAMRPRHAGLRGA
jgi:hypothetical protein